jgi:hypothetical protein
MTSRFSTVFIIMLILLTASVAGYGCTSNTVKSNNATTFKSGDIEGSLSFVLSDIVSNGTAIVLDNNIYGNSTVVYNKTSDSLTYPSLSQLTTFLVDDNTDKLNLQDKESVKKLAGNAVTKGYHAQILLIQFKNGQLFAINRFKLSDGTFIYVDCSQLKGIETNPNISNLDRILSVKNNQPITAISLTDQNVSYVYPDSRVDYETPFWSV